MKIQKKETAAVSQVRHQRFSEEGENMASVYSRALQSPGKGQPGDAGCRDSGWRERREGRTSPVQRASPGGRADHHHHHHHRHRHHRRCHTGEIAMSSGVQAGPFTAHLPQDGWLARGHQAERAPRGSMIPGESRARRAWSGPL